MKYILLITGIFYGLLSLVSYVTKLQGQVQVQAQEEVIESTYKDERREGNNNGKRHSILTEGLYYHHYSYRKLGLKVVFDFESGPYA